MFIVTTAYRMMKLCRSDISKNHSRRNNISLLRSCDSYCWAWSINISFLTERSSERRRN